MSNLICIKNLKKKYENTDYVIDDFSYSFKKYGFYVLFGNSGSGKTTLLNIICGLIPFNSGSIYFNNNEYTQHVDENLISDYIAYITQENYFIDYLTVIDNIKLCSNNEGEICQLIESFSLKSAVNLYPSQLSGGEKQRLSLIQALLKRKKIIILDEPTSALDRKNKIAIFDLLSELKKEVLIICSSHDSEILSYCDKVIDFKYLDRYSDNNCHEKIVLTNDYFNSTPVTDLFKYVRKQKQYSRRNKRNNSLLCCVFSISILIIFFSYNVESKLLKTIQTKYRVNYLTVYCPIENNNHLCDEFFNVDKVSEASFVYSLNIPLGKTSGEGFAGNINFSTDLITLASMPSNFPFIDKILYGDYFKNKSDIILGYDRALEYDFYNPKNLIGTSISIRTPEGVNEFKIVGIFDRFDEIERKYFQVGQNQVENIDSKYFTSGLFTKQYIDDEIIGYNEKNINKAVYYVYFRNFNDLFKTYKELLDHRINDSDIYISSFPSQYLDIMEQFNSFLIFLYPINIISMIIAISFYFQVLKLEINYNHHIFSVYQYYGYSLKNIKNTMLKNDLFNIVRVFGISTMIAIIISLIVNYLNNEFNFVKYQLFTFDILGVCMMLVLLVVLSVIMSTLLYKNIKTLGWYALIKNSGDLI